MFVCFDVLICVFCLVGDLFYWLCSLGLWFLFDLFFLLIVLAYISDVLGCIVVDDFVIVLWFEHVCC